MKNHVIIVAGGTGQRMQSSVPKQMLPVHGKPILIHTLEKFLAFDPQIQAVVVVHESLMDECTRLMKQYGIRDHIVLVTGGSTRFHSVKNGLDAIHDTNGIVGIHDAARPLVSLATISRCYQAAAEKGNAIPVVGVSESLRETDGMANHAVSRDRYKIVQTPQCFRLEKIKEAFNQDYSPAFTDDATVLESTGENIHLVEGNPENIKITHPLDLQIAGLFLS